MGWLNMAASEDTEITLGAGKMLALFFGLVGLCALFFSLGFAMGRNSAKTPLVAGDLAGAGVSANAGPRPSAVQPVNTSSTDQLTFYKAVEQKDVDPQLAPRDANNTPQDNTAASPPPQEQSKPPDPMAALPVNAYYVQVAAVSKQEDAEALVDALKKKQYPAFSTGASPADKLFHVQVGPFGDIKDAEVTRGKLVADGYNPILKK